MSELAGEYFDDVSATFGIPMPDVLAGDPIHLVDPALRLPIHTVSKDMVAERQQQLQNGYQEQFADVAQFLRKTVRKIHPHALIVPATEKDYQTKLTTIFDDVVPDGIITGHLRNFQIEALTQAELPDPIADELDTAQQQSKRTALALGSAHLLMIAEIHSGRKLGYVGKVARLAVEGRHDEAGHLTGVLRPLRLTSALLETNQTAVMLQARHGRGRAYFAERRGRASPYSGGLLRPR